MSHVLYRQELIKVKYQLPKFSGHGHYGSEDIMILVFHVISQVYAIKDSWDYKGRSSSR